MNAKFLNPVRHLRQLQTSITRHGFRGGIRQWTGKRYAFLRYSIPGEPIFSKEWDVLVIVDACRHDLMTEVASSHSYLPDVGMTTSTGSSTQEWMEKNFTSEFSEEIADTLYICGNPHSRNFVEADSFGGLDEVWTYAWDEEHGTILPRPITDRAIDASRSSDLEFDRLLIHYMQPHFPFVSNEESEGLNLSDYGRDEWVAGRDDWARLQRGERTRDGVWRDYRNNLRLVLEDIELLVNNIDAEKFVISSDHGNAVGECLMTGHPTNVPHPVLRQVPWIELSTTDTGEHQPNEYQTDSDVADEEIQERLQHLGYA